MARYLVIGGATGIGAALVKELIADNHEVVAASRSIEAADLPAGVRRITYDVTNSETLEGLPDSLDGLVYCPGSIDLKPFKRIKMEDWQHEMQLNFFGAIGVLQQALPLMKDSANASVVLFSTVAVQQGLPFHSSIAAAKGAVEGLVRSLAAEYAPKIRFNAIAPSLVDTPLASNLLSNERKRESNAERNPLKKLGRPEDLAQMAAYLLSEKGQWITGQILKVDGGMSSIRPL